MADYRYEGRRSDSDQRGWVSVRVLVVAVVDLVCLWFGLVWFGSVRFSSSVQGPVLRFSLFTVLFVCCFFISLLFVSR